MTGVVPGSWRAGCSLAPLSLSSLAPEPEERERESAREGGRETGGERDKQRREEEEEEEYEDEDEDEDEDELGPIRRTVVSRHLVQNCLLY